MCSWCVFLVIWGKTEVWEYWAQERQAKVPLTLHTDAIFCLTFLVHICSFPFPPTLTLHVVTFVRVCVCLCGSHCFWFHIWRPLRLGWIWGSRRSWASCAVRSSRPRCDAEEQWCCCLRQRQTSVSDARMKGLEEEGRWTRRELKVQ